MSDQKEFQLEILTPAGVIFEGRVEHVMIPGANGYFGVLAHHTPLTAVVAAGELTLSSSSKEEQHFATSGGFVEVTGDRVAVLSETAEAAGDIDIPRAEQSASRARNRLESKETGIDIDRAQLALYRALNRLRIANKY